MTALNDVLFDDFFGIRRLNLNVENVVRMDLDNGTLAAEAETAGFNNLDFFIISFFNKDVFKLSDQRIRTG